ncbi:helix-turn-helix transcriptional regulator [Winogradskyella litorisediminis]|uniref:Helix-turn-helix transcriptional regulator n=1 Tax=Winogradskyella litorisediminis TaxID=1156618 RepID=A0ABW3N945_9FLAO
MKSHDTHKKIIILLEQLAYSDEKLNTEQLFNILDKIRNICLDETTINLVMSSLKSLSKHQMFDKVKKLTDRETQVVLLISKGLKSTGIAKQLNLSKSTIETHRKNIRKKLNLKGNDSLFAFALVFSLQSKSHQILGEV